MNLKMALVKTGVSQVQMAADLCLHPSTVSRIANGWILPSPELAGRIRGYLGLSNRQLRFGKTTKTSSTRTTEV